MLKTTLIAGSLALAAQTACVPASWAQASPGWDVISEHLWTVGMMRAPDGSVFCEAFSLGRNPEGGGDYSVRLRVLGSTPMLLIAYDNPPAGKLSAVMLAVDGRQVASVPIRGTNIPFGKQMVIAVPIDPALFASRISPALQAPGARILSIHAGNRTYTTAVFGFSKVIDGMNRCNHATAGK